MDTILGKSAAVIGLIILFAVILALPLLLLWNWLMPELFGLQEIGFWQALGLSLLSNILFKSASSSNIK